MVFPIICYVWEKVKLYKFYLHFIHAPPTNAGSCIPFIVSLVFVLGYQKMGFSFETGMMIAFAVVAVWWLVMSLPLMKQYRQVHYVERKPHAMRESVGRIIETLRSVRKQKKIFLFLIAFFFFIDGVYTIIDMATAYGSALEIGRAHV